MTQKDFFLEFGKRPVALAGNVLGRFFYILFQYPDGNVKRLALSMDGGDVGDSDGFITIDIYQKMLQNLPEKDVRKLQSMDKKMAPVSKFADMEMSRRHATVHIGIKGKNNPEIFHASRMLSRQK
jgi:hypothetical protein